MASPKAEAPAGGETITIKDGKLTVPDYPIIPFIEGDGTGPDIWRASVRVFDAAVEKAYGGKTQIQWMEVYAGGKAHKLFEQLAARRDRRGVPRLSGRHQGPADHAGRRRHPLAQRRPAADARPLRLPAPGALVQGRALAGEAPREGGHGDLPREHRGHLRRHRVRGRQRRRQEDPRLHQGQLPRRCTRRSASPRPPAIGIKPVSSEGTERLVRAAIEYALKNSRKSVTLVHKGNIMKFTEGAFRNWGYALAEREFGDKTYTWDQWERTKADQGRGRRQRRAEAGARRGQDPDQGRDRRHHPPAESSPGRTSST